MSARILLVDDHVAVRQGLRQILAEEFPDATFGMADGAAQAMTSLRESEWDVAILDLNLPGRGGLDLIRELKDEQPGLSILVYTMHGETQLGVRAIRSGADGYLTKDAPPSEIPTAVRRLLAGSRYIPPDLAAKLADAVASGAQQPHELLSDREYQILERLASGQTPTQIGHELSLSVKTISTYRTRILQKLQLTNTSELIRYAIENGIGKPAT